VQAKLRQNISLTDFGGVGDGVTSNNTAVTNASVNPKVFVAPGTYATTFANSIAVAGSWFGIGQLQDASSRKLPPWFANASAAPASVGNTNSILNAFNGDVSKCQLPVGQIIQGATTLTQPATGYYYQPESYPHYTYLYNSSGWNQETAGNVGRTAACAYFTKVDNYGQGDCVAHTAIGFVTGTRAGSTSFLANPAASLFNGQVNAGADGVYLNPYETLLVDGGFDVAAVGLVNNFNRTIATGAKSAVWLGYRAQNIGTATCDALISATGKWVTGLDLAMPILDFGVAKGAISLKANDRIYLNSTAAASGNLTANWRTTAFGDAWLSYDSATSEFQIANNSAPQFVVANQLAAVNYFKVYGSPLGTGPQLRAVGIDTNISLAVTTKGAGSHFFYSNNTGGVQFAISGTNTTAVNYFVANGVASGSGATLAANGTDPNIDARLVAKGVGVVDFGTQTSGAAGAPSGYMLIKVSNVSYKVPIYLP
jgi:hypothetical protein